MLQVKRPTLRRVTLFALLTLGTMCAVPAWSQAAPRFSAKSLVQPGDSVKYGSYVIYKVGDGVYKINDPGVTTGKGGAWGTDIYLIRGTQKSLIVDLGNDYIDGYAPDVIAPRKNAAEEFRAVVDGLTAGGPLEAAVTHAHPDHDGMTGALVDRKATIWMPEGEDIQAPKTQHGIDPAVYTRFAPGKEFDLGGGFIVKSYLVRGHTAGSTVYLLTKDMSLFTGDSVGSGFGQAFPTVQALTWFAADSRKLVVALSAFPAYRRFALKVYTGHSWQNTYAGFWSPNHARIDVGYLDWRFIQDVASCAEGILKGKWLEKESGLQYVGDMEYTDAWPSAKGRAMMVYGTGTVIIPLATAYAAAGLPMPAP